MKNKNINPEFLIDLRLPKQSFAINEILTENNFEPFYQLKEFKPEILKTLYGIEKKWFKSKIKQEIQNCQKENLKLKLNLLYAYLQ